MIDTNKLRRQAQAASHPTTKGRWIRLFGERTVYDRMEDGCRGIPVVSTPISRPHPFEAACLDFIAAANPAAVIELLDRLEESESDCLEQARLNGMGSEREAALMAKLEAAEKERDALRAKIETAENDTAHELRALAASALRVVKGWERKCGELRAKIEALERMEKQEPSREWWDSLIADISAIDCVYRGDPSYAHDAYWLRERVMQMFEQRRDALPGAKGEEK